MSKYYVLVGPAEIGNIFQSYGYKVPTGRWAVVKNGEYSNGGRGPSSVDGVLYTSELDAEKARVDLTATHS